MVADPEPPSAGRDRVVTLGRWLTAMRLVAVPLALIQVASFRGSFPAGYEGWAWAVCGLLAAGTVAILGLSPRARSTRARDRLGLGALVLDSAVVLAFILVFSFEPSQPLMALYFLPVAEGALRFGLRGGLVSALLLVPPLVGTELFRSSRFEPSAFRYDATTVRVALGLVLGAVIGRLVTSLTQATRDAEARAGEAERLRDELGRRVDVLDAANRSARALGSSLVLEEAFRAFIREARGLVPFERMAIVLAEDGEARVMAAAGRGVDSVFSPGTAQPLGGSVLDEVLRGRVVVRQDMEERRHPEEEALLELGLRSRLAAPLLVGARTIGMLSIVRSEPRAFSAEEIELASLLGRLVATAVQNIRSYEAERSTVEELRRLSALRADFVSLVSHELRSPMAAVIGSARTLRQRWAELSAEQRDMLLALIGDEANRLAGLIADVLDTSRLEAGTFSFSFTDVDVGELVRESVTVARAGQEEVRLEARVDPGLPLVRGDRERLRQVVGNLIENAIKYSSAGDRVEVVARAENGTVSVDIRDQGPGIPLEQQEEIFQKFVRAAGSPKPGSGLGLFIARSIAEAHGGELHVRSAPDQGATFTLSLPVD